MLNYDDIQTHPETLKKFAAREQVPISCSHCGTFHTKPRSKLEASLRKGRKGVYCSKSCIVVSRFAADLSNVGGEIGRTCKVCHRWKPLGKFNNAGKSKTCHACWSKRPLQRFNEYKRKAGKRGWVFNLTFDEFVSFAESPCFYCGDPLDAIGLDRRDNARDYDFDNVVACCKWCNYAKHTVTEEDFVRHCQKVAARHTP